MKLKNHKGVMFVYQDNKKLLRNTVSLIVTSLLECALQTLVSYVDYIMVGKLGTEASATIGLTNEVNLLIKGGVNAVGISALSYISYSIGAKCLENSIFISHSPYGCTGCANLGVMQYRISQSHRWISIIRSPRLITTNLDQKDIILGGEKTFGSYTLCRGKIFT